MSTAANTPGWRDRVGYGSGDYALNLYWQGAGLFLLYFYTDILELPGRTAGLIWLVGGVWDAVSDLIMGYIAERTRPGKRGTYRPYILFGGPPLAICGFLLFASPDFDTETAKIAWVVIVLLLFRTSYTIVSIPYSALSARLTTDSKERTRISGVRMICGFLGGLSVTAGAAILRDNFDDATAFQILAIFIGVLTLVILPWCYKNTNELNPGSPDSQPADNLGEIFRSLAANKPGLILVTGAVAISVCQTFFNSNLLYYFEYVLEDADAAGQVLILVTAGQLVAIPLWSWVAVRLGKTLTWKIGGTFMAMGLGSLYMDQSGSVGFAFVEAAFVVFGSSAYAVLMWSMLPDIVDYGDFHTGVRNESMAFGIFSSIQKTATALAVLVTGLLLDSFGYVPGAVQTAEAKDGLKALISLIPLAPLGISLVVMTAYPLNGARLQEMRRRLADPGRAA